MAQLELENIVSGYGHVNIIYNVSLHVEKGEIVSLIGPNGAGKSTLLRTISGILPCKSGRKLFEGRDITRLPAHKLVKLGLSHAPEGRHIFAPFSVYQNLLLGCYSKYGSLGRVGRDKALQAVFEMFPILKERKNQAAGTLSGGEQQMLAIARASILQPKILLMDEPSLGLAPRLIEDVFRILQNMSKQGMTILLAEQNAIAALEVASRAYLLEEGHIVLQGDTKEVARSGRLQRVYLGKMDDDQMSS